MAPCLVGIVALGDHFFSLVCILFICCNMRATRFNSITLSLSVFLLARSLWALAF